MTLENGCGNSPKKIDTFCLNNKYVIITENQRQTLRIELARIILAHNLKYKQLCGDKNVRTK